MGTSSQKMTGNMCVCVQDLLTESSIKPPEVILPFKKEALNAVVTSMKETIHHNYMGGIVAVGKS